MTPRILILRSLRFHARSHLGTLLGATVGSAVLIGALVVGDSVRGSLLDMALARLGHVQLALASNDRFFRADLAKSFEDPLDTFTAPAIQVVGTAATDDNSARANRVQVLGVDERLWYFSSATPPFGALAADDLAVNQALAAQLNAKPGDTVLLRVSKPSKLSRDAPVSPQEDPSIALRLKLRAVVTDEQMGRFSLQASQLAPFNAFVALPTLQQRLDVPGRANLLLAGPGINSVPFIADTYLRRNWQLADAELELRELPEFKVLELRTSRVFLEPPVTEAAFKADTNAQGILTYFVNELRVGDRATPYSMVAAMGTPIVPRDLRDDEIVLNRWLADDLQAKPGDKLTLTYFIIGTARKLLERTNEFTVRLIVPLAGAAADRALMPDFPGLEKAESTRDWDPSLPVSLAKIHPKDEEYWKQYRGTPKGFVTLSAGQKMWSNRFGNLTAVRYPLSGSSKERITETILRTLDPASMGLRFEPVRAQALAAVEQSQDFGGLFLGFSFFLIAAALLLMALLFQFGIEQRATEMGTLLALGFSPRQVRRLLLFEGVALAFFGGLLGVVGGLGYARAMLRGLSTVWRDAVGASALEFHAEPGTLAIGATAAVVVGGLTIWLALRKQARQPARELLAEGAQERLQASNSEFQLKSGDVRLALLSAVGALALIGWAAGTGDTANVGAFFGAGTLLLIAGLAFSSALLGFLLSSKAAAKLSLTGVGVRNATRRRKRSLATLGLFACGSFLIASIGVFRLDVKDAYARSAGTGGFALIGESTLPLVQDLNIKAGRDFFGLDDRDLDGVSIVPVRVREGEDASCLNLNRAQKPRLLGVNPRLLAERGAFTFAKVAKGMPKEKPWMLLKTSTGETSVPASADSKRPSEGQVAARDYARPTGETVVPTIGDQNSIRWAMDKKVGDTIHYTDDRGRPFKVRIVGAVANSILQGNLLIDEDEFVRRFPSETGYRMFLIDTPSNRVDAVSGTLSRALRDYGLELTPAARRLAAFNAVQNTYLGTFQILGGLGLLLGSIGLGVVVLRNVLERRGELAVLLAVGFRSRALKWLVVSEHGVLLLSGLGIGVLSAFVAVMPAALSPGSEVAYASVALTLVAVFVSGALWTWAATMLALRGRLVDALRNE